MNVSDLTPIERVGDVYVKRDDKFIIFNSRGGKARSALQLIQNGIEEGYNTFVTAGSRLSPQCEIVSDICENMGLSCHLFMPRGNKTTVIEHIELNKSSTIHRTKVGYNNVITKWAMDYASENNYCYIPFGMECVDNIMITQHQVANIPLAITRIVVPIGSGMSFISICNGLELYQRYDVKVVGVSVGKNPQKNIAKYLNAPNIKYDIVFIKDNYHHPANNCTIGEIELDEIYEAKCLPYLKEGDLLWIVGKRIT